MSTNMQIEDYTAKSFVVRGDTTPYKEALKDMGGKWNSRLFDKKSQETFGGWIFWTDKRIDVTKWFNSTPTPQPVTASLRSTPVMRSSKDSDIEMMLKELTISLSKLDPTILQTLTHTPLFHRMFPPTPSPVDIVDDVEWVGPPPKRLLGKTTIM